jgi:hypothetical protein
MSPDFRLSEADPAQDLRLLDTRYNTRAHSQSANQLNQCPRRLFSSSRSVLARCNACTGSSTPGRSLVIARLHARGLPPHIGWADLLHEAFTRVLDGSRRQPEGVPMVAFLAGIMRSIKEQSWRQARRGPGSFRNCLPSSGRSTSERTSFRPGSRSTSWFWMDYV